MGSRYQHRSQIIVLSHDSNTKYMVKRSLFNLRIYTTRRDVRNHFTSVSLVQIFLVFMRFFFSRMKKRVQSNMLYSVDFYNLKLYKLYNKYFCLTYSIWNKTRFLFLSIQQRQSVYLDNFRNRSPCALCGNSFPYQRQQIDLNNKYGVVLVDWLSAIEED